MKKLFTLTICFILSISMVLAFPVTASADSADSAPAYYIDKDYIYEVINKTEVTILYYTGTEEGAEVTVPQTLGNLPVRSIETHAFFDTQVGKVTIPEGVTTLKDETFYNCPLLSEVSLPSTLEYAGTALFRHCTNLKKVSFHENSTDTQLGDYLFYGCISLESVENLPVNMEAVPEGMFSYCQSLSSINLPYGIDTIEDYAFYNSGLTQIELPESLNKIGTGAFAESTSLSDATIKGSTDIDVSEDAFSGCPLGNPLDTTPPSDSGKLYFEDSLNWGNIYAYCYGGDGEILGAWPGTPCTYVDNNIWSIEFSGNPEAVIFHAYYDEKNETTSIPFAGFDAIARLTGNWIQGAYNMLAEAEFETNYIPPTEPETTTPTLPEDDTITVYFTNNRNWKNVYIYGFYGNQGEPCTGEPLGVYPGAKMTFVEKNDYDQDIYSYEIPADIDYIKFSDGDVDGTNERTDNIPNSKLKNCIGFFLGNKGNKYWPYATYEYYSPTHPTEPETTPPSTDPAEMITIYFRANSDWDNAFVFAYYWEAEDGKASEPFGTWPGIPMTYEKTSEYNEKIYSCSVPSDIDYIKFSDGTPENRRSEEIINAELSDKKGFYLTNVSSNPDKNQELPKNKWYVGSFDYTAEDSPQPYYMTIYFTAGYDWENAYFYCWKGEEGKDAGTAYPGSYPGGEMTFVKTNSYGQKIYSCSVPSDIAYIKFSDGSRENKRTENIYVSRLRDGNGFYLDKNTSNGKWEVNSYTFVDEQTTFRTKLFTDVVPVGVDVVETTTPNTEELYIPVRYIGDANEDSIINIDDVSLIQLYIAGEYDPSDTNKNFYENADADRNGVVNIYDSVCIQKHLAKYNTDYVGRPLESDENPTPLPTPEYVHKGGDYAEVKKGDTITYTATLKAARQFNNIQAVVTYDPEKLRLVNSQDNMFPNITNALTANTDVPGEVLFNGSFIEGYDFTNEDTLVTLEFLVLEDSYTNVSLHIQHMRQTIGNPYFLADMQMVRDGININQYFGSDNTNPTEPDTTLPTQPKPPVSDGAYRAGVPYSDVLNAEDKTANELLPEHNRDKGDVAAVANELVVQGDVNGDRKVTIKDATAIQKDLADLPINDFYDDKYADTTADGEITIRDATLIQKFVARLINNFPDNPNISV